MNNFTPHAPYFLYFPVYCGLTFVELDIEVIISSLHQPVRLWKMHETELLTKAICRPEVGTCTDWMRSRVMAMSNLFNRLSKCSFADIFIFTYYYTMPISRSYFLTFIFFGLGKVAGSIDGVLSPLLIDNPAQDSLWFGFVLFNDTWSW